MPGNDYAFPRKLRSIEIVNSAFQFRRPVPLSGLTAVLKLKKSMYTTFYNSMHSHILGKENFVTIFASRKSKSIPALTLPATPTVRYFLPYPYSQMRKITIFTKKITF